MKTNYFNQQINLDRLSSENYQLSTTDEQFLLDVSHLPKGVYVSTLELDDTTSFSRKIVLQ